MTTRTLFQTIIKDNFDYFIEKVKAPMMNTIIQLGKLWPTPTWENLVHPNAHLLLKHMEEYEEYEQIEGVRKEMMLTAFKVVIDVYDHDVVYRKRLDNLIESIVDDVIKGRWQPNLDESRLLLWSEQDVKNYKLMRKFRTRS